MLIRTKSKTCQGVVLIGLRNELGFSSPEQTASLDLPKAKPTIPCRVRDQLGPLRIEFDSQNIVRMTRKLLGQCQSDNGEKEESQKKCFHSIPEPSVERWSYHSGRVSGS